MSVIRKSFMQTALAEIERTPDGLHVSDLVNRSKRELGSSRIARAALDQLELNGSIEVRAVGRYQVAFPSRPLKELVLELIEAHGGSVEMSGVYAAFPHRSSEAVWEAVRALSRRYDVEIDYGVPMFIKLRR